MVHINTKILKNKIKDFSLIPSSEFQNEQTRSTRWFCEIQNLISKNSATLRSTPGFVLEAKTEASEIDISSFYLCEWLSSGPVLLTPAWLTEGVKLRSLSRLHHSCEGRHVLLPIPWGCSIHSPHSFLL